MQAKLAACPALCNRARLFLINDPLFQPFDGAAEEDVPGLFEQASLEEAEVRILYNLRLTTILFAVVVVAIVAMSSSLSTEPPRRTFLGSLNRQASRRQRCEFSSKAFALTWYCWPARPFAALDVPLLVTGQQGSPSPACRQLSRARNTCAGGSSEESTKLGPTLCYIPST